MTLLLSLLVFAVVLYVGLSVWGRRERRSLGLEDGSVIAADDARLQMPTLRSARHGLVGRPDHLLRSVGLLIPVEQKPNAHRAQPSHIMQVAAQCLLVEDVYGVRPPYGVLVLAGGVQERVPFTPSVERRLLGIIASMRQQIATDACHSS
jgi:CRISPR-associated exonuclease Cas4